MQSSRRWELRSTKDKRLAAPAIFASMKFLYVICSHILESTSQSPKPLHKYRMTILQTKILLRRQRIRASLSYHSACRNLPKLLMKSEVHPQWKALANHQGWLNARSTSWEQTAALNLSYPNQTNFQANHKHNSKSPPNKDDGEVTIYFSKSMAASEHIFEPAFK